MAKARADREFLPAALSILETPPSPVKIRLIWTICGLFVFVIAWSYFGRIDIIAVAQGKIQPTGRVKTVQPIETGKVVAIHVENSKHIRTGETLIELDAAEAGADYADAMAALVSYRAERLRRLSALDAVRADKSIPILKSIGRMTFPSLPARAKSGCYAAIFANWRSALGVLTRKSHKRGRSKSALKRR